MKRTLLIAVCIPGVLALASCRKPSTVPPVPTGVQTMTGVLIPADLGLLKRGTHILRSDGEDLALVESATVNLRPFENRAVGVRGIFEQNADPSLPPVLVVSSITPVREDMQKYSIPSLGLTCLAPEAWKMVTERGVTKFLLEGIADPIVIIAVDPSITDLPSGSPFLVDGRHATRSFDAAAGSDRTVVDLGSGFLSLRFHPTKEQDADALRAQWFNFLTSVRFSASGTASGSVTGSGSGVPCGGTAGILCPGGEYCAVTDFKENIGRCKPIRK